MWGGAGAAEYLRGGEERGRVLSDSTTKELGGIVMGKQLSAGMVIRGCGRAISSRFLSEEIDPTLR